MIYQIVDRLLENDEEFCYFDLKIYLFAKHNNATVVTNNLKAFQEINDPVFRNFFKDVEFLFPQINCNIPAKLEELNNSDNYVKSIISDLKCMELDSMRFHVLI